MILVNKAARLRKLLITAVSISLSVLLSLAKASMTSPLPDLLILVLALLLIIFYITSTRSVPFFSDFSVSYIAVEKVIKTSQVCQRQCGMRENFIFFLHVIWCTNYLNTNVVRI